MDTICCYYTGLDIVVKNSGSQAQLLQLKSWLCNILSNLNNLSKLCMLRFLYQPVSKAIIGLTHTSKEIMIRHDTQ